MGDSVGTQVSIVPAIYAPCLGLGLWRWASRRGYVPLRIHVGDGERSVQKAGLVYVLLGDGASISREVARGAGVGGVEYKGWMAVALRCFCKLGVRSAPIEGHKFAVGAVAPQPTSHSPNPPAA
jgi:hypothetical protein